jgi:hypothetical protein
MPILLLYPELLWYQQIQTVHQAFPRLFLGLFIASFDQNDGHGQSGSSDVGETAKDLVSLSNDLHIVHL